MMTQAKVTFCFRGILNDFLKHSQKGRSFGHQVNGIPTVGDTIESLGVPHTEVASIQVNGKKRSFHYHLRRGGRIKVIPRIRFLSKTKPRFILDVHLGKLAKYLRLMGLDTLYRNDFSDAQIAAIAKRTRRIVLTRDVGLLKFKIIQRGYWLRNTDPKLQLKELMFRFFLKRFLNPLTLCLVCNGRLLSVSKRKIMSQLPPKTRESYHRFYRCRDCCKIYWAGTHYKHMEEFIRDTVRLC